MTASGRSANFGDPLLPLLLATRAHAVLMSMLCLVRVQLDDGDVYREICASRPAERLRGIGDAHIA